MEWGTFAATVGLGIAGLDPVGAMIATAGIAAGARRRAVLVFFASSLVVTVVVGVVLGESVQRVVEAILAHVRVPDPVRLWAQVAGAVALAAWAVLRIRHRRHPRPERPRRERGTSTTAMLVAGVLWGVAALTDATFYATAALTARDHGIVGPTILLTVWFVVSQLPLCAVTAAYLADTDGRVVARLVAATQRLARGLARALTVLVVVAAALLVGSSATYLATGAFLPV